VDDDAFNSFALKQLIDTIGYYQIDVAVNGKEAIAKVLNRYKERHRPYRLIVMDLNMPLIDGKTATKELRKLST
jgi:CheY-like chemotaxis protein